MTGALGAAVSTRSLAAGGLCLFGSGRVGVLSTQARFNPLYGEDGLKLLTAGASASDTVSALVEADSGQAKRQLHVLDTSDRTGQHTGTGCTEWAGHVHAEGVSVAGNMLAGETVVRVTLDAYRAAAQSPLRGSFDHRARNGRSGGWRQTGTAIRRHQALVDGKLPVLDLRVDDHPEPLAELRRLYQLARERYIPTVATLATRQNPAGIFEDAERERAMAASRAQILNAGLARRSARRRRG